MQKYWTEYQRAMEASRRLEPFYVRYDDELIGIIALALSTWFVWGIMRAVGAPREGEQKLQSPLCDFCGYNLTTMPMEARCPECGEPVLASLGPQVRPGAPWQDRRRIGRVTAYFKTLALAVFRPSTLGRRIRLYHPGRDPRPWLGLHCLFLGVFGMLMPIVFMVWSRGGRPIDLRREFFQEGVFVGFAVGGITFGALLLSAGLIGVIWSLHARRNLLPAAVQIVSYLSGFVVLGVLFGFLNAFVLDRWSRELTQLAQQTHVTNLLLGIMLFILPNLAWIIWTQFALASGISAARYANR